MLHFDSIEIVSYLILTLFVFQIVAQIEGGMFTPEEPDQLRDVVNMLKHHDRFMVCADFDAYVACQDKVEEFLVKCDPTQELPGSSIPLHH